MCPYPGGEDAGEHEEGRGEAGDGEAGEGVGERRCGGAGGVTTGDAESSTFLKHPEGSKSSEEEAGGAD